MLLGDDEHADARTLRHRLDDVGRRHRVRLGRLGGVDHLAIRHRDTGGRHHQLGDVLLHRQRRREHTGMSVGNRLDFQDALQRAVLARRAMQYVEGDIGLDRLQHGCDVAAHIDRATRGSPAAPAHRRRPCRSAAKLRALRTSLPSGRRRACSCRPPLGQRKAVVEPGEALEGCPPHCVRRASASRRRARCRRRDRRPRCNGIRSVTRAVRTERAAFVSAGTPPRSRHRRRQCNRRGKARPRSPCRRPAPAIAASGAPHRRAAPRGPYANAGSDRGRRPPDAGVRSSIASNDFMVGCASR